MPTRAASLAVGLLLIAGQLEAAPRIETGVASYYGLQHQGRRTASGARFDAYGLTAASLTWPLGSRLKVCIFTVPRCVTVTVTDRGPFNRKRVIDLSLGAAQRLGIVSQGLALVVITAAEEASH